MVAWIEVDPLGILPPLHAANNKLLNNIKNARDLIFFPMFLLFRCKTYAQFVKFASKRSFFKS